MADTPCNLYVALNELRNAAGAPSLREVGHRAGLSHTTVDDVLTGRRVHAPKWSHVERIVNALGGNPDDFRALWAKVAPRPTPPVEKVAMMNEDLDAGRDLYEIVRQIWAPKLTPWSMCNEERHQVWRLIVKLFLERHGGDDSGWWTTTDVAAYLGVESGTVSNWRRKGRMPPADKTTGRTQLWRPATILDWDSIRPGKRRRRNAN